MDFHPPKRKHDDQLIDTEKVFKKVKFGSSTEYAAADDVARDSGDDSGNDEDLEVTKRRGQVNLDGYDSESDDEVAPKAAMQAQEDDMFAELEELNDGDNLGKDKDASQKKKTVKFMASTDIEGQEWNEDNEEYTDTGVKIMPFNMDEELEEGAFDENGMYIRKKDEHAQHDKWLIGVTKEEIEKAKAAQQKNEEREREKEQKRLEEMLDEKSVYLELLRLLKQKESVAGAIARLGEGTKKQPAWKLKQKNKKKSSKSTKEDVEMKSSTESVDSETETKKKDIEKITGLADQMMARGNFDIYDQTYEAIVRKLRIAEVLPEDWLPGDPLPSTSKAS